jgi:hypothetical protein
VAFLLDATRHRTLRQAQRCPAPSHTILQLGGASSSAATAAVLTFDFRRHAALPTFPANFPANAVRDRRLGNQSHRDVGKSSVLDISNVGSVGRPYSTFRVRQKSALPGVRENGITSRMLPMPEMNCTTRSKPRPEAGMRNRAVPPQVEIPPVILGRQFLLA